MRSNRTAPYALGRRGIRAASILAATLGLVFAGAVAPLAADKPTAFTVEGPNSQHVVYRGTDGHIHEIRWTPGDRGEPAGGLGGGSGLAHHFETLILQQVPQTLPDEFVVVATVPFLVSDDVQAAADALRPFYALYFGGMGAKGKNFHANVAIRMGYESMIDEVQELYLSGKKDEAGAAIPFELIEELSLIGPADKIRDDVAAWRESIVTTLLIAGDANTVRQAAEIVLG